LHFGTQQSATMGKCEAIFIFSLIGWAGYRPIGNQKAVVTSVINRM